MKAFLPVEITDSMLVSSTIAEPDVAEPAYSQATTYAEFAQVSDIGTNRHDVYESLVSGNVGNPLSDESKWIFKKIKTNRWRMFDYNQGDPSIGASPMTVVIRPGKVIDALMLEGLKASLVDVTIRNGIDGQVVFTLDGFLLERNITTFTEFFSVPLVYARSVSKFEIPLVPDPVIYVTLSDPSGTVELSRMAVGRSVYLGPIQWNPISDADNYSEITRDQFGRATLFPIPNIPLAQLRLEPPANMTNAIRQFRDKAGGRAVVWSGLDDIDSPYRESLVIIGVYDNFSIDISNKALTVVDLSLIGI